MIDVTREMVLDCWSFLEQHFGSRVCDKSSAEDMQLVSQFLEQMGVLEGARFMNEYTTTAQNVIYTPFVVGDASTMPLYNQLHICLHEHQHVHQWNVGRGNFVMEYTLIPDKRAAAEAEAMHVNMELDHWLGRPPRDIPTRTRKLKDYALDDVYIATVNKRLSMVQRVVNKGGIETDVGKVAIPYLESLTG